MTAGVMCGLVLLAMVTLGGSLARDGQAESRGFVYSFELSGSIDTDTKNLLDKALEHARTKGARLVVMRLNTRGGSYRSTRTMVSAMAAAPLPVVVYVAPGRARARDEGLVLTLAGDVAAMAPQTRIIVPPPPVPQGTEGNSGVGVLYRKILNDLVAYVRSLAERHGRDANLVERMVRKGRTLKAPTARRKRLVDMVAPSEAVLLKRLDGFRIKGRKSRVLHTSGLRVVRGNPLQEEDEDTPRSGTVLWDIGVPGVIAMGMVALAIAYMLLRLLYGLRPRFLRRRR